ncbi:MAG: 2-isopropylmalate synthase [Elusimicrobia bacterium]|nr:2-isopropylmalate synthase [Candidatus Liberimonas magnetica]
MKNKKIIFFDTTLRDGEQSPGASMNIKEKIEVARQLERLGVDIIEAGFPISSPGDFESVKLVAKEIKGPAIAGLCRANTKDINTCWNAVKYSKKPRIHIFLSTSDLHIKRKLQKTREEVFDMAVNSVRYAKKYCEDIEFSAEDASRSDFDYLESVVEAVIDAGATTLNIPDTVGYAMPEEFGRMINKLHSRVRNIDKTVLSIHCHNDLGLAVANSLAAILNGARQIECTINGIGERAGNASLEEVVMALKTRKKYFGYDYGINTRELYKSSRLVSMLTGILVQPNKAVVGSNAFAHEAGIHQDGVIKERLTYEIMRPQDVGVPSSKLVLGKHSGRHALLKRLKELGYGLGAAELEKVYEKFKVLTDKKKVVFDDDIAALVEEGIRQLPETYALNYLNTSSGTGIIPTATIRIGKIDKLNKGKRIIIQEAACGDGPVDAAYKAIDKIVSIKPKLIDYSLRAISSGKDAQGEVSVKVEYKDISYSGRGTSTDIIEASAKAYLKAINKIMSSTKINSI